MIDPIPITIIGNLTDDPELATTADGHALASFTIATTPSTRPHANQTPEETETVFLRCAIRRHPAEHAAQTLRRGMRVIIFGRLTQHISGTLDGEARTDLGCEVHDVGPSLRYATASLDRHHNPPTTPRTTRVDTHTATTADGQAQWHAA